MSAPLLILCLLSGSSAALAIAALPPSSASSTAIHEHASPSASLDLNTQFNVVETVRASASNDDPIRTECPCEDAGGYDDTVHTGVWSNPDGGGPMVKATKGPPHTVTIDGITYTKDGDCYVNAKGDGSYCFKDSGSGYLFKHKEKQSDGTWKEVDSGYVED